MTREQVLLTDVDGNIINLNDRATRFIRGGRGGTRMPPFTISSSAMPTDGGSILSSVLTQENNITLPLLIQATETVLEDELRHFARIMNPLKGDVTIQITRSDSSARKLTCRYAG